MTASARATASPAYARISSALPKVCGGCWARRSASFTSVVPKSRSAIARISFWMRSISRWPVRWISSGGVSRVVWKRTDAR